MAKKKMDIALKKCITPEFRVSFPAVFKPAKFEKNEPKYGVTMLFPKKTDISALKKAAFNAAIEQFGSKENFPEDLKWPWKDGDKKKKGTPGYAGTIYISARSKESNQPGIVDQRREPIISEKDFYAGCYARAEIIAYYYDVNGNEGISFSLQNVQKLRDGEAFSGKKKAEDVFDEVEMEEDDQSFYDNGDEDENDMGF